MRPNYVVFLCDDLGYGDLGCQGNATIRTQNIDAFARTGVRFTDFYAAAPVCSASRAGLLTGRTPNRCGVYDWIPADNPMHLRKEEVTFASLLRSNGYATAHVGKWHLNGKFNSSEQPQPGDHGFEHWFSTQNNAAPAHENPDNFVRNGAAVGPLQGYSSTIIVEEAMRWLDQRDASKPFCLFVCPHSPHEPIGTAEEFSGLYATATKRGEALYYGNVTQLDHEFGRLMKRVDRESNTMVWFTSDNGPETLNRYEGAWRSHGTASPLKSMKLSLYEGGYRVPGIVQWKGRVKAGGVSSEPVCAVDFLPTMCELSGVFVGRKLDGASLAAFLTGRKKQVDRHTPLHWHYFNALDEATSAMRDGDWKILGIPKRPAGRKPGGGFQTGDMALIRGLHFERFELYNVREDVGERRPLASGARLKTMADQLVRLHKDVQADGYRW